MEVRFDRRVPNLDRVDQAASGVPAGPDILHDHPNRAFQGSCVDQDQHSELDTSNNRALQQKRSG
jgi:hypothetical protein